MTENECPFCKQISICKKPNIPHGIKYKDTCSICWEDMIYPQDRNLATFEECGHTFHNECIQTWIHYNNESTHIIINNNNIIINLAELQIFNPTSHWCFDHELNQWVLVDNATGYFSWQEETPQSFLQNYTPVWLNYPRRVRYRRKWILAPNEMVNLYMRTPIIPESYIPNGIFDTWIFDDDLDQYVLVNNESGYLSWQVEIPETNLLNYTPHWVDNQYTEKYHKRWVLVPNIDPETQYPEDFFSENEEYFNQDDD